MKQLLLTATLAFCLGANAQVINTYAGNGTAGFTGDGGAATAAEMFTPFGVVMSATGNLYIADYSNHRIRMISTTGVITTVAGTGTAGYNGDGGAATAAEINYPQAVALDGAGNLYIADNANNRVRMVNTAGIISTIAGNGTAGFTGDGAAATAAELHNPHSVAADTKGDVYIVDQNNDRVRMVNTSGIINTIAGNGTSGFTGDGAAATAAELANPTGVAVDAAGNVYISDGNNERVRMVNTSGIINTIAGNGTAGFAGDGGAATAAELHFPNGLTVVGGNVYIADYSNQCIRMINTSGVITTIAGDGTAGFAGDGGQATAAELDNPRGVALNAAGDLFIADATNNRIREVLLNTAGINQLMAGNNQMNVYPNPATGVITIEGLVLNQNDANKIVVFDMLGNCLVQQTYSTQRLSLDVSNIQPGIYFIKTSQGTQKFVKQ